MFPFAYKPVAKHPYYHLPKTRQNKATEEKELCKKAIAEYKEIRSVVQFGDIYRLISPYEKQGVASLMYTTPEKDKAVVYWWK